MLKQLRQQFPGRLQLKPNVRSSDRCFQTPVVVSTAFRDNMPFLDTPGRIWCIFLRPNTEKCHLPVDQQSRRTRQKQASRGCGCRLAVVEEPKASVRGGFMYWVNEANAKLPSVKVAKSLLCWGNRRSPYFSALENSILELLSCSGLFLCFCYWSHAMRRIYLNENWRQAEAWIMLFGGALAVNALA